MTNDWKSVFLENMARNNEIEARLFLDAVDEVANRCTLDIARILMKSFTNKPDYGTQERVVSVLASAEHTDRIRAMLEELPRLIHDAPDWAEVLVGQEVDRRPNLLVQIAQQSESEIIKALMVLLANDDFNKFYPNAKELSDGLRNDERIR